MKKLLLTCFALALWMTQVVHAQFLNQTPPPQVVQDASGANVVFDYALPLKGITTKEAALNQYQDQPVVLFYFSAQCPHCKRAFPKVQSVYNKYKDMGVKGMAIAVSHNSRVDVQRFVKEQKAEMPFTQDASQQFSKKYGVGHVPMVILVQPDGSYIVYDHVDSQLADLDLQLKAITGG